MDATTSHSDHSDAATCATRLRPAYRHVPDREFMRPLRDAQLAPLHHTRPTGRVSEEVHFRPGFCLCPSLSAARPKIARLLCVTWRIEESIRDSPGETKLPACPDANPGPKLNVSWGRRKRSCRSECPARIKLEAGAGEWRMRPGQSTTSLILSTWGRRRKQRQRSFRGHLLEKKYLFNLCLVLARFFLAVSRDGSVPFDVYVGIFIYDSISKRTFCTFASVARFSTNQAGRANRLHGYCNYSHRMLCAQRIYLIY